LKAVTEPFISKAKNKELAAIDLRRQHGSDHWVVRPDPASVPGEAIALERKMHDRKAQNQGGIEACPVDLDLAITDDFSPPDFSIQSG